MEFRFKNLDDCHYGINLFLLNGRIPIRKGSDSSPKLKEPLHIYIKENVMEKTFNSFGYTEHGKLSQLKKNYIDEEELKNFETLCNDESYSKNVLFKFKQKSPYAGKPRDNCLLNMYYIKERNEYIIVWRTTEFVARFGADLYFFSLILTRECSLRLMVLDGWQNLEPLPGIFELCGYDFKSIEYNSERTKKIIFNKWEKFFKPPIKLYFGWFPVWEVQYKVKVLRGEEIPPEESNWGEYYKTHGKNAKEN